MKTVLIDTHCHLHDRDFFTEAQAEEMLKRAREKGIEKIVCIGTTPEDSVAAQKFANAHENVYWTYGVHPSEKNTKNLFEKDDKLVAIGEVGLDYHYGNDHDRQIKLFKEMLELAKENNLPVVFHIREAFDDFFEIIKDYPEIKGIVHSFSDSKKNLKKVLEQTDFYIGVNGLATYSTLPTPPLDRTLLETDAPFLTPVPFRGIINESGYIREIAEWLAAKLATNFDQVEKETTSNAEKIFEFEKTDC